MKGLLEDMSVAAAWLWIIAALFVFWRWGVPAFIAWLIHTAGGVA